MQLDLFVKLAKRARRLSFDQFAALEKFVNEGHEDPQHLGAIADCLADLVMISGQHQPKPLKMRFKDREIFG